MLFLFSCSKKEKAQPVVMKILPDYPSASAVEYQDGELYIMGDDATKLLVLDTNLNIIDSISIIQYTGNSIPKNIKPDLEASALISNTLILFGSGSLVPYRNSGRILDLKTNSSSV